MSNDGVDVRMSDGRLFHARGPATANARSPIFSVKEWRDFENQVRGRSRSLKMAPFDRSHATFYWSAIVTIALSCTIFELFDVE